jgi:hypothetical protein
MLSDRNACLAARAEGSIAATAIFVGAFLLLQAAPARADSNFERGFEDQMGRILAYEAVNLGKHILVRGVIQPYPAYPAYPAYPVYPAPAVYYGGHPGYGYQPYVSYGDDHRHGGGYREDRWRRHDHDRGYWGRGHRKHHHHHDHHDHDDCD